MKTPLLLLGIVTIAAVLPLPAASLWESNFVGDPFVVGETIHGKDGWNVSLSSGSPTPPLTDASIIQPGGDGSRTYLQMYSTATAGNRNTSAYNTFERVEDRFNRVELSLAWTWTSVTGSYMGIGFNSTRETGGFFHLATSTQGTGNPRTDVGLRLVHGVWNPDANGGEGAWADAVTLLLPTNDLMKEHFYQFAADIDFQQRSFTISMTDEAGNSVLTPELASTVFHFRSTAPEGLGISRIDVYTLNANAQRLFLESAKVFVPEPIPEPGSVTLALFAAAGALLWQRGWRVVSKLRLLFRSSIAKTSA